MIFSNKINIIPVFLVLMGCLFTSCERDAKDVNLPYIEPKLVVQCFISPQNSEIAIYVSTSKPVFGTINSPNPTLPDANVILSDGTISSKAIFNSLKEYYVIDTSQLKIVVGKTYTLRVVAADGRTATATCTVPPPPDTNGIDFDYDTIITRNGNNTRYNVRATLKWQDVAGQPDYYQSEVQLQTALTIDTNIKKWEEMYGDTYSQYFTDKGKDGKKIVNGVLIFERSETITGGGQPTQTYVYSGMRYYILRTEENYYKYHETASRSYSDPFTEPVIVHTNIEGGLGCFGAYNGFYKEIKF